MAAAFAGSDAENQRPLAAEALAAQHVSGQGTEQHALLGEEGPAQRSAWVRRLTAATGVTAAVLLLGGAGSRALGRAGSGGGGSIRGPALGDGMPPEITGLSEDGDCSLHGAEHDCSATQCCKSPHRVCFGKDADFATCMESCVPGEAHGSCAPLGKGFIPMEDGEHFAYGALKSHHGKYVVADRFNGRTMKADAETPDDWEKFKVYQILDYRNNSNLFSLQSFHSEFVACEPHGGLIADRSEVKGWEEFIWLNNEDETVSLLCAHTGKYLRATPSGFLHADADRIDDWEKFIWEPVPDGVPERDHCSPHAPHDCSETKCCKDPHRVCFQKNEHFADCRESCVQGIHHNDPKEHQTAWSCKPLFVPKPVLGGEANESAILGPPFGKKIALKSSHEKYIAAHPNGYMEADREEVKGWETFTVHHSRDNADHKFSLKSDHGKWVACEQHYTVKADRTAQHDWEEFIWVDNDDGSVSLLCHTGKYWNVPPGNKLKAEAHLIGSFEEFKVEIVE